MNSLCNYLQKTIIEYTFEYIEDSMEVLKLFPNLKLNFTGRKLHTSYLFKNLTNMDNENSYSYYKDLYIDSKNISGRIITRRIVLNINSLNNYTVTFTNKFICKKFIINDNIIISKYTEKDENIYQYEEKNNVFQIKVLDTNLYIVKIFDKFFTNMLSYNPDMKIDPNYRVKLSTRGTYENIMFVINKLTEMKLTKDKILTIRKKKFKILEW